MYSTPKYRTSDGRNLTQIILLFIARSQFWHLNTTYLVYSSLIKEEFYIQVVFIRSEIMLQILEAVMFIEHIVEDL